MEKLLTEDDLAARWGITKRTLRQYRKDGKAPPYIVLGSNVRRYRIEDVVAFEEARARTDKGGPVN